MQTADIRLSPQTSYPPGTTCTLRSTICGSRKGLIRHRRKHQSQQRLRNDETINTMTTNVCAFHSSTRKLVLELKGLLLLLMMMQHTIPPFPLCSDWTGAFVNVGYRSPQGELTRQNSAERTSSGNCEPGGVSGAGGNPSALLPMPAPRNGSEHRTARGKVGRLGRSWQDAQIDP